MAKAQLSRGKKGSKKPDKPIEIPPDLEIDSGAWEQFEKLVKSASKMGPKPHKKG